MNKLMGFYELRNLSLPTIPWREYTPDVIFHDEYLWTVRSAVFFGNDMNLPRLVGKEASEAMKFANKIYKEINKNGIVVYYPYFIAHKSGTLNVHRNKTIIEAVDDDLWNLVTNQDMDVSLTYDNNNTLISCYGNEKFLTNEEIEQLLFYARSIARTFRDELIEGCSMLLEWSFASSCNKEMKLIGEPYLVFYEIRTIK